MEEAWEYSTVESFKKPFKPFKKVRHSERSEESQILRSRPFGLEILRYAQNDGARKEF